MQIASFSCTTMQFNIQQTEPKQCNLKAGMFIPDKQFYIRYTWLKSPLWPITCLFMVTSSPKLIYQTPTSDVHISMCSRHPIEQIIVNSIEVHFCLQSA